MKPKIVDCDRDLSCVEKVIVIVKQVRASAMSATYVRKSFWKRICTTDQAILMDAQNELLGYRCAQGKG